MVDIVEAVNHVGSTMDHTVTSLCVCVCVLVSGQRGSFLMLRVFSSDAVSAPPLHPSDHGSLATPLGVLDQRPAYVSGTTPRGSH